MSPGEAGTDQGREAGREAGFAREETYTGQLLLHSWPQESIFSGSTDLPWQALESNIQLTEKAVVR